MAEKKKSPKATKTVFKHPGKKKPETATKPDPTEKPLPPEQPASKEGKSAA